MWIFIACLVACGYEYKWFTPDSDKENITITYRGESAVYQSIDWGSRVLYYGSEPVTGVALTNLVNKLNEIPNHN